MRDSVRSSARSTRPPFVRLSKTCARRPFRASLRVKGVRDQAGIFEMTWDMPNGRATFRYGSERLPGEQHIIWLRIGGHEIF